MNRENKDKSKRVYQVPNLVKVKIRIEDTILMGCKLGVENGPHTGLCGTCSDTSGS